MKAPPLLLRLDATHVTGMGHAMRVRHLLDAMASRPPLLLAGCGEVLRELFPEATLVTDSGRLADIARQAGAGCLLNDTPAFDADAWAGLELPGIVLDDFGGDYPADLVINGTVLPSYHRYPHLRPGGRALCGGEYALLHPAFAQQAWRPEEASGVSVVIGGGERALAWSRRLFSGELDFTAWGPVSVCVGRAFPAFEELAARAADLGVAAFQGLPAPQLALRLAQSRVALITGGMVLYECMALGAPTLVFPQLRNLEAEATWFAGRGCALDLGFEGGMDLAHLAAEMSGLLADPARAAMFSRNARAAIDGGGLVRAAAAVDAFLAQLS